MNKYNTDQIIRSLIFLIISNTVIDIANLWLGDYSMYLRILFYAWVLYLFIMLTNCTIRYSKSIVFIIVFHLYTALLVLSSSNIFYSFKQYIAVLLAFICYIISLHIFSSFDQLKKFKSIIIVLPILMIINSIMSNYFNLGITQYNAGFYSGSIETNKIYSASLSIVLWMVLLPHFTSKKKKIISTVIILILSVIILLTMRRTGIIIVLLGVAIYFILHNKKSYPLFLAVISSIFLFISYPIYRDTLSSTIEARAHKVTMERGIEAEIRYKEILSVSNKIFSFSDPIYSLFGTELYNSRGTYNSHIHTFQLKRLLHSDYSTILHGSGLLGFLLYVMIFVSMYRDCSKLWRNGKKTIIVQELKTVFLIFFILVIVISIPGRMTSISFRTIIFSLLGATTGILYKNKYRQCLNQKH